MTFPHRQAAIFYLLTILRTDDDAITVINRDSEVIFWNDSAEKTYNIPHKQIVGQPITNFFKKNDLMVLTVLHTEKSVKNVYHRPREDKHVFVNASPIYNERQQLIGAVSVERDITSIVKLNDKLSATSNELNELRQKVHLKQTETPFSKLKGGSAAMQQTVSIAMKAAKTDATILILGESGTGKELCAQAIHEASERKKGPFIPVNCGAIPHALFESELFGYERGAFTGASREGKPGKIEMADGGTVFLDEIGELPLDMQVKLLRVLQENTIYRIGGTTGRHVNVRFIAATNRHLGSMMEQEEFRSDLYYRLNVVQITMPSLRERLEDIPELVELFLNEFAARYQMSVPYYNDEAMQMLLQYRWPGNIRELRNIVERSVILAEKNEIGTKELLHIFPDQQAVLKKNDPVPAGSGSLTKEKKDLEKRRIEQALHHHRGNKSAAARDLGISRVSLYKKMKKYNISHE